MARMMLWAGVFAVGVVGLTAWAAWAEDLETKAAARAMENNDPDTVDPNTIKGEKWTLDFTHENPEPIVVTDPQNGEKQVYWYVVYTITNKTGAERSIVPTFTLYGDTGAVRRAGLYPTVHDAIRKSRKVRFLENAVQVIGKISQGDDSARTGVAIFAPLERETDHFTVFVEGLSGEYVERPDRSKKIEPGHLAEGDKLLRLRKTLALAFDLPGDKWWLNLDQPIFKSKKWTWR